MIVDTHCHLDFDAFDPDRDAVIARSRAAGVTQIILPSIDLATSAHLTTLAQAHEGIYATVGIHPNGTSAFTTEVTEQLRAYAAAPRVVAVGEIGLDYYWDKSPKTQQRAAFEAQLALAASLELPVIIHNRDASDDTIAILEAWSATLPDSLRGRAGVLHSFSAPRDIADRAVALGFYLGFTGPLTFKKADDLRSIAAAVPLDRLLVETDAPFLTPTPHRGERNEPAYTRLIIERLAALRGMSLEAMADQTTANAHHLFKLT